MAKETKKREEDKKKKNKKKTKHWKRIEKQHI
jgi:hypothetical protein